MSHAPVDARTYAHPLLGDRRVVRLVADSAAAAYDVEMTAAGFMLESVVPAGEVDTPPARFPGIAILALPDLADALLPLTAEVDGIRRLVATRPSQALAGLATLQARLELTLPQVVPFLLEDVARSLLAEGNAAKAATLFGKARQVEAVYGLPLDEDRHAAVMVEFAEGGALTVKSLVAELDRLVSTHPADEAWRRGIALFLGRAAAGVPPQTSLVKDLSRLAVATGHTADDGLDALLLPVLRGAGIGKAPAGFWTSLTPVLSRRGESDVELRRVLASVFPEQAESSWPAVLESSGALRVLTGNDPEVSDDESRLLARRWCERVLDRIGWFHQTSWMPALQRIAPAVAVAGSTVHVPRQADLDLVDVLLEHGVEVDLTAWRPGGGFYGESDGRRSYVIAHPVLGPALRDELLQALEDDADRLAPELRAGWQQALLVDVLDSAFAAAADGRLGLLRAELLLNTAATALRRAAPDLRARAAEAAGRLDPAALLAAAFNAGLAEELAWPALDDAPRPGLHRGGFDDAYDAWPDLIVVADDHLLRIGRDGSQRLPRLSPTRKKRHIWDSEVVRIIEADGDVHESWYDAAAEERRGTWASSTGAPVKVPGDDPSGYAWGDTTSLPLPEGGRVVGSRVVRAGDPARSSSASGRLASDGTSVWLLSSTGWRRLRGPATDHTPPFLAAAASDGWTALPQHGWCRPAPWAETPLGQQDGLAGVRVLVDPTGRWHAERTDGVRAVIGDAPETASYSPVSVHVVSLPHGAVLVRVRESMGWRGGDSLRDGRTGAFVGDVPDHWPAADWWHALRPVDAAASETLRSLRPADVAAALSADDGVDVAAASLVVTSDDRLRAAITARLGAARAVVSKVAALTAATGTASDGSPPTPPPADRHAGQHHDRFDVEGLDEGPWDMAGMPIFEGLLDQYDFYGSYDDDDEDDEVAPPLGDDEFTTVRRVLDGDPAPDRWPSDWIDWGPVVTTPAALLVRAASPTTTPDHRAEALRVLRRVCQEGLLHANGVRVFRVRGTGGQATPRTARATSGARVVRLGPDVPDDIGGYSFLPEAVTVVVRGLSGRLEAPLVEVVAELSHAGPNDATALLAAADRLVADGPPVWDVGAAVERLAALTGRRREECGLLLLGLPPSNRWDPRDDGVTPAQVLGMKATAVEAASRLWSALPSDRACALVVAAVGGDVDRFLREGPDVSALAVAWTGGVVQAALPDAAYDIAKRLLGTWHHPPSDLVARAVLVPGETLDILSSPSSPLDESVMLWLQFVRALPEQRQSLRASWVRLQEFARKPGPVHLVWHGRADRVGVVATTTPSGAIEVVRAHGHAEVHVGGDRVTDADVPVLRGLLQACYVEPGSPRVPAALLLFDDSLHRLADGDGGHDPRLLVPDLVADVASRLGIDSDAASLYLLVLSLPDPTDANVQTWLGWTPTVRKRHQRTLVDAGLLVEGSRARARRSAFLPGAWWDLKAPGLPLEAWKGALVETVVVDGRPTAPLGAPVLLRTPAEQYAEAWQLVVNGDGPGGSG